MVIKKGIYLLLLLLLTGIIGCANGNDDDDDDTASATATSTSTSEEAKTSTGTDTNTDDENDADAEGDLVYEDGFYQFESGLIEGDSSVSYSGQSFRHMLILGIKDFMGGLTEQIDSGSLVPEEGDIVDALNSFYQFDSSVSGALELPLDINTTLQKTYDDVSSNKDLQGKIAGNDAVGQHKDWATEFVGWDDVESPDALVQHFFEQVETLVVNRVQGANAEDPDGNPVASVYVSAEGLDYRELTQKFLLGAVNYSQAMDDYLDNDTDGKGLLTENVQDDDKPYTKLQHQWDEGFGYFGATRDYNDYTDDELAAKGGRDDYQGAHDTNDDGLIDVKSEMILGNSANAGKRDRGSSEDAATDFSKTIFDAFLAGRALLNDVEGELSDAQMEELVGYRDMISENWEKVIAATVLHYINDVLQDMNAIGTDDYSFATHAKHWSELKGFALGLQFNRFSALSDEQFASFHEKVGIQPVLGSASIEDQDAYKTALIEARTILVDALEFDAANVGDENGEGGW